MFGSKAHIERDRAELIEVITCLKHEKRLEGADVASIERSMAVHMDRLGQLDRELAAFRAAEDEVILDTIAKQSCEMSRSSRRTLASFIEWFHSVPRLSGR